MKNTLMFLLWVSPSISFAADPMPKCYDRGRELSPMNEAVVQYKQTMPNLKKIQVLVKTKLVEMMANTDNSYGIHQHFIVSLREDSTDSLALIEVSHSMNGYTAPSAEDLKAGPIYICGEYSTTNANGHPRITRFTPSATGAMLHWTHQASRQSIDAPTYGHSHGWIYANGKVFGRYSSMNSNSFN